MRTIAVLPVLGSGANKVMVLEWLVPVGSTVREGDILMTVETDKVNADVPAPLSGTLVAQLVGEGDEIDAHTPIAEIES